MREYASADVSRDKIGSTAWAPGPLKIFRTKKKYKKLSGNLGAIWGEVTYYVPDIRLIYTSLFIIIMTSRKKVPVSTFGHVVISASPWCIFPYNLVQDIFIKSKVIDIFPKFKMAAAAILDFQFMWI